MFKLTRQEQMVVVFLVGAILLGSVVRQWRQQRTTTVRIVDQGTRGN